MEEKDEPDMQWYQTLRQLKHKSYLKDDQCRGKGHLTAGGKGIKNQNEILKLLEAVWESKEIAVIHCKGHQEGKDSVSEGNQHANATAKLAAKEQAAPAWIILAPELPEPPKYTPQEEKWAQKEGRTAVHPYKPGDQFWVKDCEKEPLKPTWKGPYPVILTTPSALKVAGLNTWIHHSRVKADQPSDIQSEWKVTSDQKHPLEITLKKTADLAEQPAPRNSDNTLLNSP
ncbi:uncharacterized protein LOC118650737 [Myotis myotis]|uniref:uncharacterized protein LOC118650737 n=1 Tax=Myotis myotis TaxID=51298 RepID=UPI0017497916|nr:uncharacterized protein LOC118650737 [Myotis myotis]